MKNKELIITTAATLALLIGVVRISDHFAKKQLHQQIIDAKAKAAQRQSQP